MNPIKSADAGLNVNVTHLSAKQIPTDNKRIENFMTMKMNLRSSWL
jgi:hypothetical protein